MATAKILIPIFMMYLISLFNHQGGSNLGQKRPKTSKRQYVKESIELYEKVGLIWEAIETNNILHCSLLTEIRMPDYV